MNPCPYMVFPWTPVPLVFNLFRTMGLRHLIVINTKGQVIEKAIACNTCIMQFIVYYFETSCSMLDQQCCNAVINTKGQGIEKAIACNTCIMQYIVYYFETSCYMLVTNNVAIHLNCQSPILSAVLLCIIIYLTHCNIH